MIVIDVGCHPQGPEESVHKLIDRFHPEVLFGFDPYPELEEGLELVDGTVVVRRRVAAWTSAGREAIRVEGITTGLTFFGDPYHVEVDAIDLPAFVALLPAEGGIVLKLDAEGVEYPILYELARQGLDQKLQLVLVEWHPEETAHDMFATVRPDLRCPIEDW